MMNEDDTHNIQNHCLPPVSVSLILCYEVFHVYFNVIFN